MRLSFSLLAIGLFLIGVLGCKKEAVPPTSEQAQQEQRWLRVYHDGEFKWKIDVSGWEVGEDVVPLGVFYYPWQGKDSINWTEYDPYYGHPDWMGPYLVVNDKVVGVNLGRLPLAYPEVQNSEKIITATFDEYFVGSDFDPAVLEKLPNLIGLTWYMDSPADLKRIEEIPSHLRIYLHCGGEITGEDFKWLSDFSNIRVLGIGSDSLTYRDLRYLCRFKELRRFILFSPIIQWEKVRCLRKLKKLRYWDIIKPG